MLVDVAAERGIDITELVREILTAPLGDRTICIHFIIDEADIETNLRHRDMMVGSDGIPDLRGRPHPRLFGTFPRVLARYVRERGVLGLEEAVRRMTSLSAETFGLVDRGRVKEGYWADLVLFDPATVHRHRDVRRSETRAGRHPARRRQRPGRVRPRPAHRRRRRQNAALSPLGVRVTRWTSARCRTSCSRSRAMRSRGCRCRVPSVGVLHDGAIYAGGVGITNVEHPLPVTRETLFQIGSTSKTVTATALMQLVEERRVDLDAKVRDVSAAISACSRKQTRRG